MRSKNKTAATGEAAFPFSELIDFQEGPGIRKYQHRNEGVPFLNIRGIKNNKIRHDRLNCLDPDEVTKSYSHFLLMAQDIIVSSSGTLGKVAQITSADLPCLTNTGIIRMRSRNQERLAQDFLLYFLQSPLFQQQIHSLAIGSVQKNFGPAHLKQMWFYMPPIKKQHAIAGLLGKLDALITSTSNISHYLRALNHALFKYHFSQCEGEEGSLGQFCKLMVGGDWGKEIPSKNATSTYCLRGVDLVDLYQEGNAILSQRWIQPTSLKKRAFDECDIVIAGSGAGACGQPLWINTTLQKLYNRPIIYSNFCRRLRTNSPAAAIYITHLLQHMYDNGEMQHYINGTSIPNLDVKGLLKNKKITMPPKKQLERYANQVMRHYELHYSQRLEQMRRLKQLLLSELFIL